MAMSTSNPLLVFCLFDDFTYYFGFSIVTIGGVGIGGVGDVTYVPVWLG